MINMESKKKMTASGVDDVTKIVATTVSNDEFDKYWLLEMTPFGRYVPTKKKPYPDKEHEEQINRLNHFK